MEGSNNINNNTTAAAVVDAKAVEAVLVRMRDEIAAQDGTALQKSVQELQLKPPSSSTAVASVVLDLLVPLLFRKDGAQQSSTFTASFSSQDALNVLGVLVQSTTAAAAEEESSSSSFLQAASGAIRTEAERRANGSTPEDDDTHVSPALVDVLVQQLSGSRSVQVADNATRACAACGRRLGAAFAETVLVPKLVAAWRAAQEPLLLASTNSNKDGANNSSNSGATRRERAAASTRCIRCAAAVVEICLLDDFGMRAALSNSALELFWELYRSAARNSDPLLQMSLLDLLEKLALHRPLLRDDVLEPVLRLAGGWEDDDNDESAGEPDPILGGTALRVVAALCHVGFQQEDAMNDGDNNSNATSSTMIQRFHRALHNFVQASDGGGGGGELDRLALVDAISSFAGASPAVALPLVLDDPVTRQAWLSLAVAQPKLKAAILVSVARVLDPPPQVDAAGDRVATSSISNTLGTKLFSSLGLVNAGSSNNATDLLLSLAKSPLPETRLGAYTLMEAVAKLPSGGQVLFMHGDFYPFLLNRDLERTKEGREAKFAVVQTLLASEVKGLLAEDIVRQLETYVAQGPHYVKTLSWELAEQ